MSCTTSHSIKALTRGHRPEAKKTIIYLDILFLHFQSKVYRVDSLEGVPWTPQTWKWEILDCSKGVDARGGINAAIHEITRVIDRHISSAGVKLLLSKQYVELVYSKIKPHVTNSGVANWQIMVIKGFI